jgi:hypothetical protein
VPIEIFTGDAAVANAVSMPANVLMYSGPGLGKSTDAVAAFCKDGRCTAFVAQCEPNAIKAPISRGLPTPEHSGVIETWEDMQTVCAFLWQNRTRYSAAIFDGFSVFSSNLYKQAQETVKSKSKWDIPVFVRTCLLQFRSFLRSLGLHTVIIAHAIPPGVQEGVFYQGGFALTPKSLINEYFSLTDTVLRVDYVSPAAPTNALPPAVPPSPVRVYFTGGQQFPEAFAQPPDWRFWRTKNREGCNDAIVQADLGAFLRGRRPPYAGL